MPCWAAIGSKNHRYIKLMLLAIFLLGFGGHMLTITTFILLLATISEVKSLPSNLLGVADLVESNKT